ncbi:MAG: DNA methyltransferase [Dehalococcoidia bacterium]
MALQTNTLYYGDNLHILREYIPDESVDLVYLDPPFNSNRSYNVLFKEAGSASSSPAQIEAFEDTWHWGKVAQDTFEQIALHGSDDTARLLKAMVDALGHNDVTAYLAMMSVRLVELRRVLKPTGSIYLHCDPTASHYLKVLMDSIFGAANLVNEIVWKRSDAHNDVGQGAKHMGRVHDIILFYRRSHAATFNPVFSPLPQSTVDNWYRYVEPETGRRYNMGDLSGPGGAAKGSPVFEWHGVTRAWRFSKQNMKRLDGEGRLVYSKTGIAYMKRYLDESKGVAQQDWWDDIQMLRGIQKGERLGYATQKPLALLERIVATSSNEGDVVLDPFCGCGTAVHAAQKLGRRWIGIDITHLAINLIKRRMQDAFPGIAIKIEGEPADVPGAQDLAARDAYQFQWWALSKVDAIPAGGDRKKGMDRGIDGIIPFVEGSTGRRRVIVSVKSGNLTPAFVRDLKGVLEHEGEPIGVLQRQARRHAARPHRGVRQSPARARPRRHADRPRPVAPHRPAPVCDTGRGQRRTRASLAHRLRVAGRGHRRASRGGADPHPSNANGHPAVRVTPGRTVAREPRIRCLPVPDHPQRPGDGRRRQRRRLHAPIPTHDAGRRTRDRHRLQSRARCGAGAAGGDTVVRDGVRRPHPG